MPDDTETLLTQIEAIQKLVVEPVVNNMKTEMAGLRRELHALGDRFDAVMRSIQDPESGYVPRSEIDLRFDRCEDRAERDATADEGRDDRIAALEAQRLPPWFLPAFGIVVAIGSTALSVAVPIIVSHWK